MNQTVNSEGFQEILNNLDMGIIYLKEHKIQYVNIYLTDILKYSEQEMIGKDISAYIYNLDLDYIYKYPIYSEKMHNTGVLRCLRNNGEIISFYFKTKYINLNSIFLLLKQISFSTDFEDKIGLSHDYLEEIIDHLRSQSEIVNREKKQIELILNNIKDGVIVLDQDGKAIIINTAAERLIKRILSEIRVCELNFVLSTGHPFFDTIRTLFLTYDINQKVVVEVTSNLFLEFTVALNSSINQNSLVSIIEFRDITPFIEFENLRKKFVSVVSHELRTPISALNLSVINLQRYGTKLTEEEKIEIINSMGRSAAILNQQVDDLLILSRFDAGKGLKLKWEKYHILGTIYSVIAQLEPRIYEKKLNVQVLGSEQVELMGDVHRIEQIFRIILDNAIKYSSNNSNITIKVTESYKGKYSSGEENKETLIEITDQGMGISKKDIPHIFTRFYRSDDVSHIQGTGIGLALARELVYLHKGAIYVESEYKKGSTFSIVLPELKTNPQDGNSKGG
ncbi:MAG: hypothetical protein EAX86_06770 [Candidatus Heimdallarchaeota archaeon]|nr:hypothetical protein [Candidatus Heimdallarchaeota archaeon]